MAQRNHKLFTIADDSGIVVPELNFEPGIYSARYAGEDASDKDNRDKIISEIKRLKKVSLNAYYVCVLVGVSPIQTPFHFTHMEKFMERSR